MKFEITIFRESFYLPNNEFHEKFDENNLFQFENSSFKELNRNLKAIVQYNEMQVKLNSSSSKKTKYFTNHPSQLCPLILPNMYCKAFLKSEETVALQMKINQKDFSKTTPCKQYISKRISCKNYASLVFSVVAPSFQLSFWMG